ncbi:MAG TPA: 3-isopropylmalate dehydratase small subunit [Thermoleophilaceae bacterium]|nr:3-isopropylmalate dehydratase small subunit [Thermoleophilaceae bacterium]
MDAIRVIEGAVSVLDRADVDTDQIIPKQFLKRVERTGFGEFLFYDWAKEPGWSLEAAPILAAGRNFGCGSSREHAPWALEDYGFKAIVAPSFADIFFSNCTKIGLLPVVLSEDEVRGVMAAGRARIDLESQTVTYWNAKDSTSLPNPSRDAKDSASLPNPSRGACGESTATFEIDQEIKRRLLNGLDDIGVTLQSADAIAAYERDRERAGPVTVGR